MRGVRHPTMGFSRRLEAAVGALTLSRQPDTLMTLAPAAGTPSVTAPR
jgi:hypothetical protein